MIDLLAAWDWWPSHVLPAIDGVLERILPAKWGEFRFMRYALIECVLLAPICAAMGVKVVNFRMAFFSDAISHSAFAGIAIGFLLNEGLAQAGVFFDPRIALILFALVVGLAIAFVRRKTELSTDTVIGVVFSTVVALGIAIITSSGDRQANFGRYLYGDILTLDATDLGLSLVLAGAVLAFMAVSFNRLALVGLNDELAHSRGVRVRLHDYLFSLLLALVVAVSIRTAGILLVTAMLIVPAAAARNLARSLGGMFWWALLIGLLSGLVGTIASFSAYLENVGTGAVIVLAAALFFALSFAARQR